MISRVNTSLECVTEQADGSRKGTGVSPGMGTQDKGKGNEQQKRLLRNLSESYKNTARGGKTKRSQEKEKEREKEREESLKRKTGGEFNELLKQLVSLKGEYQTLKGSYNSLIKEKLEVNQTARSSQEEVKRLMEENSRLQKQVETCTSQISHLQGELERIKKQSIKLLEVETYKMKRLEENIKEKQRIIASRNQSSLSFCHQDIAMTQIKDYMNRIQPIYSHRNLYTGMNTDMCQQKLLFHRNNQTVDYPPINLPRKHRRGSSQSSMNIQIQIQPNYNETTKEEKKNPFEAIQNFKSEVQKKKRSITNSKLNSGKKKQLALKGAFVKSKKMNNQTLR